MSLPGEFFTVFELMMNRQVGPKYIESLRLTPALYKMLCDRIIEQMKDTPTLVRVEAPARIVGDLAGQFYDLKMLLLEEVDVGDGSKWPAVAVNRWVFLGGYVNRSIYSLETITLLFCLRLKYPHRFVLLRGSDETEGIGEALGFKGELMQKFNHDDALMLFDKFNEAFSWMPLACLISGRCLCMHGGISPYLNSLDDINNIPRPFLNAPPGSLAMDLLWADISDHATPNFIANEKLGVSVKFNENAVFECLAKLNVDLIVRSSQIVQKGADGFAGNKLVTIFSAPNCLGGTNIGATLELDGNLVARPSYYIHQEPLGSSSAGTLEVVGTTTRKF